MARKDCAVGLEHRPYCYGWAYLAIFLVLYLKPILILWPIDRRSHIPSIFLVVRIRVRLVKIHLIFLRRASISNLVFERTWLSRFVSNTLTFFAVEVVGIGVNAFLISSQITV